MTASSWSVRVSEPASRCSGFPVGSARLPGPGQAGVLAIPELPQSTPTSPGFNGFAMVAIATVKPFWMTASFPLNKKGEMPGSRSVS